MANSIAKPRIEFTQVYQQAPTETVEPMRTCLVGPNRELHRYSDADEKPTILVGEYDREADASHPWPERTAGGVVEDSSVVVRVDDAKLKYFEDLVTQTTGGRGENVPVSGTTNRIRSTTINFQGNDSYSMSALLGDRGPKVGDAVRLRGVVDPDSEDCETIECWNTIQGFAADAAAAIIGEPTAAATNSGDTELSATITQIDGPLNCVSVTANATAYDGLPSGYVEETYTIEIIQASTPGCASAKARVTSGSGTDNVAEVLISAFGDATAIGTRGLTVTWNELDTSACSASAENDDVPADTISVGQIWRVTLAQDFEAPCVTLSGTHTGTTDDTYIIEVTKGGTWADLPEVTITTTRGLDANAPQIISGVDDVFSVGNYGLTALFGDCYGSDSSSAQSDSAPFGGDMSLAGLRKGDRWYITVTGADQGPIRTLILQDDIPVDLRALDDLDLELFIVDDIVLPQRRIEAPPLVNYEIETTQIVLKASASAYHPDWTIGGVPAALELHAGSVYVEYHELLPTLTGKLTILGFDEIDTIPGPLAVENTLKWAAFRAFQNSNGAKVAVVAIMDPTDLDHWTAAASLLAGRTEYFSVVPLTYDADAIGVLQALVESESGVERANFKRLIVNLQAVSSKMVVGKSSASAQLLRPTSTDGNEVLAVVEDDPSASGTQYTRFRVPAGNANFRTYGVQAGDIVRCLYSVDPYGETTYTELVVDSVVSENTLLVLSGLTSPLTVAQKIEVWHPYSAADMATDLAAQGSAYANKRVVATFPDYVGTGGQTQSGLFLAAAVGGLMSGIVSHQPTTFLELAGFDDLTSRTTDIFTEAQLDEIAGGGVLICTEDMNGTPMVRHGLTTDTTDVKTRSEMFVRNVDACSLVIANRIRPYVGKSNVTPSLIQRLKYELKQSFKFLKTANDSDTLGPQMIEGEIVELAANPLLLDTIDVVIDGTFPLAADKIRIFLRV